MAIEKKLLRIIYRSETENEEDLTTALGLAIDSRMGVVFSLDNVDDEPWDSVEIERFFLPVLKGTGRLLNVWIFSNGDRRSEGFGGTI